MIRHILFWNYTEEVKEKHGEEEALRFMQDSVATMNGNIDGNWKEHRRRIRPCLLCRIYRRSGIESIYESSAACGAPRTLQKYRDGPALR